MLGNQKRIMKTINKDPVKLRARKTRTGVTSLYLDIYTRGQRKYEYLRLYLLPGTAKEVKDKNRATLRLAEAIRAKRAVEMIDGLHGYDNASDADFLAYFRAMAAARPGLTNWQFTLNHLEEYQKKPLPICRVDAAWVRGWVAFLRGRRLAESSAQEYHNKVVACLNRAVREGLIPSNPCRGVTDGFKPQNARREYLTVQELRELFRTEKKAVYQRAFLFSCLTGMRVSDISALTWGDVTEQSGMTRIIFRQKKTKKQEYLDIDTQAAALMGERGDDSEAVFNMEVKGGSVSAKIRKWAHQCGIRKHLTFHSGRHTFAVMMLDLGTDIYTVSKLLGHTDVKTTQIYAKVLDKAKREAVMKIPRMN